MDDSDLGSFFFGVFMTLVVMSLIWMSVTIVGETDNGIYYITTHWSTYQLVSSEPIELKQIIIRKEKKEEKEEADEDNTRCQCYREGVASQSDTQDQGVD